MRGELVRCVNPLPHLLLDLVVVGSDHIRTNSHGVFLLLFQEEHEVRREVEVLVNVDVLINTVAAYWGYLVDYSRISINLLLRIL